MSKIEIGRWAELLKRISGIAGADVVAGDLSPEVSPTLQLEDLNSAEFQFLKSVRLCFGANSLGAAAGFTTKWRLRNPANSGVIAQVSWIEIVPVTNDLNVSITFNQQTVDFPTAVLTSAPDARWNSIATAKQTTLIMTASNSQATGPAGDFIAASRTQGINPWMFQRQIPMMPGTTLDWGTASQNVAVTTWVSWTERGFPELER